jgi:hypothetical protein
MHRCDNQAGMTGLPEPTPSPRPTPGEFQLSGLGPVASVEIIGHPVHEPLAEQIHALHLCEVITYTNGKRDLVGYFPEGKSVLNTGDPLYVETRLDGQSQSEYIAEGRKHYSKMVEPVAHQTLDQFVAAQEQSWKAYNVSRNPPTYDYAGNDLHNSNGAMVASIENAGRPDIAAKLIHDLEPRERIYALENGPDHLSAEAAAIRLVVERFMAGKPSAPGASHQLTQEQVRGQATTEPAGAVRGEPLTEGAGIRDAALSVLADAFRRKGRATDMLDGAPGRDGGYFTVMHTDANGKRSLQRVCEPFQREGTIHSADAERVTQQIGRDKATFTYRTEDLLSAARDRDGSLRLLEQAAANHEVTNIKLSSRGLDVTTQNMERGRGHDLVH